ncbi:protein PAXX isoform X4 [Falco peregrinus]|uniref:protein PAXX isoform X4 n=1 Tax=Falco peregrinus TaxID=8954 RepID=UPI002479CD0F|nr:protein PAXX isoform X4 [Falco peregrinus]
MAEPAGPFRLLRDGPRRYLCYCGPGGTVYVTDALEVWAGELDARPPLDCVCTGAGAAGGPGLPRGWGPGPAASGRAPSPPQRCQPEEHGTELREALGRGAAALSLGEGKATLQLREEARCSALELFKLPMAQARSQLQALVFGMAGCIESLERRLEAVMETLASSCSPEKNTSQSQQLFLPDAGPARLGCWRLTLGMEGLAGLPKQLADLLQSPSCLSLTEADPSPRKNRGAGSALPAKRKIPGESLINPGFRSKKAPSGVDFEDS